MTAIAAIREDGVVWIGGDSAGAGSYSIQTRRDRKVFVAGEFAMGYTTSFRMGQILHYHFKPPMPYENEGGMGYMVRRFIPTAKKTFEEHGFKREGDGKQDFGGTFLVGWRGELYTIYDDFQVAQVDAAYHACGCGEDLVLGSLHTTDAYDMSPKERIVCALRAAEEWSAGVRGPFHVVSSKR